MDLTSVTIPLSYSSLLAFLKVLHNLKDILFRFKISMKINLFQIFIGRTFTIITLITTYIKR